MDETTKELDITSLLESYVDNNLLEFIQLSNEQKTKLINDILSNRSTANKYFSKKVDHISLIN